MAPRSKKQVRVPNFASLTLKGLKASAIEADGNCQFSAFSDQLYGDSLDHFRIRTDIVQCMRDHPDDFKPFVMAERGGATREQPRRGARSGRLTSRISDDPTSDEIDRVWEGYLAKMAEQGTKDSWGDNFTLKAFSMLHGIRVLVHHSDGNVIDSSSCDDCTDESPMIELAYDAGGNHYWSARKIGEDHRGIWGRSSSVKKRTAPEDEENGPAQTPAAKRARVTKPDADAVPANTKKRRADNDHVGETASRAKKAKATGPDITTPANSKKRRALASDNDNEELEGEQRGGAAAKKKKVDDPRAGIVASKKRAAPSSEEERLAEGREAGPAKRRKVVVLKVRAPLTPPVTPPTASTTRAASGYCQHQTAALPPSPPSPSSPSIGNPSPASDDSGQLPLETAALAASPSASQLSSASCDNGVSVLETVALAASPGPAGDPSPASASGDPSLLETAALTVTPPVTPPKEIPQGDTGSGEPRPGGKKAQPAKPAKQKGKSDVPSG